MAHTQQRLAQVTPPGTIIPYFGTEGPFCVLLFLKMLSVVSGGLHDCLEVHSLTVYEFHYSIT